MKRAIEKCWRDSASLIVLTKSKGDAVSSQNTQNCNYDILLQTRPIKSSYSNSVVFPGGVSESADAEEHWLNLIRSFGFSHSDFEGLHQSGASTTPIFGNNPILSHISLRITAIRETFEELGLLICSTEHKTNRSGIWANIISDIDVKYWQKRVSDNPAELFNLCKERNCYPDIWSLHYWSNWLTPVNLPKRFDTAFFLTALKDKPVVNPNSEVVNIEWATPLDTLEKNRKRQLQLYPPQGYELNRLTAFSDLEQLTQFAKQISCKGNDLLYPVRIRAKDGILHLMPGDHLYPSNVDDDRVNLEINKTLSELRDTKETLHRIEASKAGSTIVIRNYTPKNHINMGDQVVPLNITLSAN